MLNKRQQAILDFIRKSEECTAKEILDKVGVSISIATLKRELSMLIVKHLISTKGRGKATRYVISPVIEVFKPYNIEDYYNHDIDDRDVKESFDFSIIEVFSKNSIFTKEEFARLEKLQSNFCENISQLSESEYKKEFERLAIDLSWKSSQIEGNTYSLLETEMLLKEKETAAGKTKEEAVMLLNHKDALDFIIDNQDYLYPLSVSKIEDIHTILTKELAVDRNLRRRRVGISGTNYKPLDNEFQIKEALEATCKLVNNKESVFEKALLVLIMLSYIQPFMDGNKCTARIVSNALLMNEGHCPLSFRTVNSIDYKKAMLLFYEQNNISAFKQIFIDQFEFAVNTYF